jgi:hypothetical protein
MNDEFTRRAYDYIAGLKRDISEAEAVIQKAETARQRYREQLTMFEQALAIYAQVMELPTTTLDTPLLTTLHGTIADMCAQIIAAHGRPATVRELVTLLANAGKFKNAANYRTNYGTVFGTLQRDERFHKAPNKGVFDLAPAVAERHGPLFSQSSGDEAPDLDARKRRAV